MTQVAPQSFSRSSQLQTHMRLPISLARQLQLGDAASANRTERRGPPLVPARLISADGYFTAIVTPDWLLSPSVKT